MSAVVVSTTAGLLNALGSAVSGEVIELTPGVYSNVLINHINPAGNVTIMSQNSANQAVITGMTINQSSHLTLSGLNLDASGMAPGAYGGANTWMTTVENSSNINLTSLNVHGASGVSLSQAVSGINFEYDTNVSITHSTFQNFHHAVSHYFDNYLTASYNTLNHIYDDGFRGAGSNNVTITNNSFSVFHMDASDTDHPDLIQFWTSHTIQSASHIYIANNTYTRGSGGNPVQGVFMRDEVGTLPYLNVVIKNNNFSGSLWNGIYVSGGQSVSVTGNTLTSYTDNWTGIDVFNVTGGSVTYNYAYKFQYVSDKYITNYGNVINAEVPVPGVAVVPLALQNQQALAQGSLQPQGPQPLQAMGFGPGFSPLAAPEPATWACLLLGMAILGGSLRARRAPLASA